MKTVLVGSDINTELIGSDMNKEYVIEGSRIRSLEEFYDEVSRVVIPKADWGRNLDAFNDILSGGFGTPENGFSLRWANSSRSKDNLSYEETARQLRLILEQCHPSNRETINGKLSDALARRGSTVFDWLVEIIEDHGPSGDENEDNVTLILE